MIVPIRDGSATASRLYDRERLRVRAHVTLRRMSCPFPMIERSVPSSGRILDVGCGYGWFSLFLALSSSTRRVLGVDIDDTRLAVARRAAARVKSAGIRVDFQLASPGQLPRGPWDAVVVVDVLYLLDHDDQVNLLRACVGALGPGGLLLVKEMDTKPLWKLTLTRLQETIMIRSGMVRGGSRALFTPPSEIDAWMQGEGLEIEHLRLGGGYPYPHHLLIGRARR